VYYVYEDGKHGLIAAISDQSTGSIWHNGTNRNTGTHGNGINAGAMNTALIVAEQMADNPTGTFAAKISLDYSVTVGNITYGDWYLPSRYELNLLWEQRNVVGGFTDGDYWSSSEWNSGSAWIIEGNSGFNTTRPKDFLKRLRSIRAF
jgi:hypothetical protein